TGSLDVIDVYTTDAQILRYGLRILEDDRRFFPTYDAVILYRADLAPRALKAMQQLEGKITATQMQQMNARAIVDRQPENVVAAEFLREQLGIDVEARAERLFDRLLLRTGQHLTLVLVSLVLGILTAVPLGVLASRNPVVGQTILGAVGVLQTFPAL